jgi:TonB family protein
MPANAMNCAPPSVTLITADAGTKRSPLAVSRPMTRRIFGQIPILSVVTLVVWAGCAVVGGVGLTVAYARPTPHRPEAAPIVAEILEVELTHAALTPYAAEPLPAGTVPDPPPVFEPIPALPEMELVAVAEPSPAIAFALPVEGPALTVDPRFASHTPPPVTERAIGAPAPQVIAYGQGEGRQPAPVYPWQAKREGQEGMVTVRFSVGENGRVLTAEAVTPAPWPLLNEAALRAVKERWRFQPGSVRLYEVAIRFELKR